MKDVDGDIVKHVARKLLQLLPWLIIVVGGTFAFARVEQIQNTTNEQIAINAKRATILASLVKSNRALQVNEASIIGTTLLRQCVQQFNIDDDFKRLAKALTIDSTHIASAVINHEPISDLSRFADKIRANQAQLHCSDYGPTFRRQCLVQYNLDDNFILLSKSLLEDSSQLGHNVVFKQSNNALSQFFDQIDKDQQALKCTNPSPPKHINAQPKEPQ